MNVKWFFVLWGLIFTGLIMGALYYNTTVVSKQSYEQFTTNQNKTEIRFDNTSTTHKFLLDNTSEILTRLDPVLDEVQNATQLRLDQEKHYDTAITHFNQLSQMNETMNDQFIQMNKTLSKVVDIVSEDTNILAQMNKSLDKIINGLDVVNKPLP